MLQVAEPFLEKKMHPRIIVSAYNQALIDAEECMKEIAISLDLNNQESILNIIRSTIGTKFISRYGDLICNLALQAVMIVRETDEDIKEIEDSKTDKNEFEQKKSVIIDTKRFARVERIPGGQLEDYMFWME